MEGLPDMDMLVCFLADIVMLQYSGCCCQLLVDGPSGKDNATAPKLYNAHARNKCL